MKTAAVTVWLVLLSSTSISHSALGSVSSMASQPAQSCPPTWHQMLGIETEPNGYVAALAVFDDGQGSALYVGGNFATAGGTTVNNIAKWDGTNWSALGAGTNNEVWALTVFDDGSGEALYVGGNFTAAGGMGAYFIAKWDGSNWTPLGAGMGAAVDALTVFDEGDLGSGQPLLYAGGWFTTAGDLVVNSIAKWDGSSWAALGNGVGPEPSSVTSLAVYDDGNGPALYAGGGFETAGGVEANNIARWDGMDWSGLNNGMNSGVFGLAVFDDGGGPALYAGGEFTTAGGVAATKIAKWDGSNWAALGSGLEYGALSLVVFDDGNGPALYVGGNFTIAGGVAANYIAKWNGSAWSALGSGMNTGVWTFTVFDDGNGPALYAGGSFTAAGGLTSNYIAKWGTSLGGTVPLNYCTAGQSAGGCQAEITACGTASASASSGFSIAASGVEGTKDGLFFFGTNGQQANPWGNGTSYQCVVPPVVRSPTMTGTGMVGTCDGSFALDLNALWCPSCPKPAKNPGMGAAVQTQLWYRDPASTSNQTTSLSDAVEFVVGP